MTFPWRRWSFGLGTMLYRIIEAPPGYPPDQNYMVAMYRTLDYDTLCGRVRNAGGSQFFETVEAARKAIPANARRLPFDRDHQFLELWEAPDAIS